MTAPVEISRAYSMVLMGLHEAGGAATLDRWGRLECAKTKRPLQGDAHAWMKLVSLGLVAGEHGRVLLTQLGRDTCASYERGRVREA